MAHLGRLLGSGTVKCDGNEFAVTYEIDVLQSPGGMKSAEGRMRGDFGDLHQIFTGGKSTLQLETGGAVEIIIRSLNFPGIADILISGPVPGF